MNVNLKPTFTLELSAHELVLILKALKKHGHGAGNGPLPEYLELLDKISRARLQQVEAYAKQLALSLPENEE